MSHFDFSPNSTIKDSRFKILIADDSEEDRFLFKSAIGLVSRLEIIGEVSNGTEAISYLHGMAPFGDRKKYPLPDLLLLDLKMPFKDGFDVLTWLRAQRLRNIMVVVLTDSMNPEDVKRALDLGADYYLVKSRSHEDRKDMAHAFEEYLSHAFPTVPSLASVGREALWAS